MTVGERTREAISTFYDFQQMGSLLASLQRPFPHLTFGKWTQSNPPRRREYGDVTVYKKDRSVLRVRIRLSDGRGIACKVGTLAGVPIPRQDREAVRSFADFVGALVESLSIVNRQASQKRRRSDILPVHIDLGSLAVGRYAFSTCKMRFDPTPLLLHLRSLSQQTYENHKISYGLIISRRKGGMGQFPPDVRENRRYLAVSDGARTALKLDRDGKVLGLVPLEMVADEAAGKYRPSRFDTLASSTVRDHLALGLSEHGDIVGLQKGSMLFSLSQGHWQVWNHAENVAVLRRSIQRLLPASERGVTATKRAAAVAHSVYSAALDLSFQRRGGLFVILPNDEVLSELIQPDQRPDFVDRHVSDRGLDLTFLRQDITRISRDVICDLAALDGAMLLGARGNCLAYGAIIKLRPETTVSHRGARYQAAREAARLGGVSMAVSSDGSIEILTSDGPVLKL